MESVNITIRTDKQLKKDADAVLNNIGMNMTTAITIFMKALVRTNGIPFPLNADPFYSKTNMDSVTAAVRRLDEGKYKNHDLIDG